MKQGLAIHTTSGELGLATFNNEENFRIQSWDLGKDLANNLQEKIMEFLPPLTWKDIDFLAVAKGPGSFTSTRIGIVTAKTIAQQLNIPVIGISTLESFVWYQSKNLKNKSFFAVEMKANLQEVFGAIYQLINHDQELVNIIPEQIFIQEKWQKIKEEYKDKYTDNYNELITGEKLGFTVSSLLEIAMIKIDNVQDKDNYNWQFLTPFYR